MITGYVSGKLMWTHNDVFCYSWSMMDTQTFLDYLNKIIDHLDQDNSYFCYDSLMIYAQLICLNRKLLISRIKIVSDLINELPPHEWILFFNIMMEAIIKLNEILDSEDTDVYYAIEASRITKLVRKRRKHLSKLR